MARGRAKRRATDLRRLDDRVTRSLVPRATQSAPPLTNVRWRAETGAFALQPTRDGVKTSISTNECFVRPLAVGPSDRPSPGLRLVLFQGASRSGESNLPTARAGARAPASAAGC